MDVATDSMTQAAANQTMPRPFGLGSIALAGVVGGPLAAGYLVDTNLRELRRSGVQMRVWACIVALSALWFWSVFNTPPDLLSQLLVHLPQALLWWAMAAMLLRSAHRQHALQGGQFRSAWSAFGIAVGVNVVIRLVTLLLV
jgi:hypothetical protein